MGVAGSDMHAAEQPAADSLLNAFKTIDDFGMAKHSNVLDYWLSIRGDREFPPLHDLDPLQISDAGPCSALLELIGGGEDAEVRHLGETLKTDVAVERIADAPRPSILACIANKLSIVAISRNVLAFEDEFPAGDAITRCWVTLLPLSSAGPWVDYVYAFVTFETVPVDAEAIVEEEPEALPELTPRRCSRKPARFHPWIPRRRPRRPSKLWKTSSTMPQWPRMRTNRRRPRPRPRLQPKPARAFRRCFTTRRPRTAFMARPPSRPRPRRSPAPSGRRASGRSSRQAAGGRVRVAHRRNRCTAKLAAVRAKADEARMAKLKSNSALYEGLSAAYDFALDAEDSSEEYLKLVEAQGLKIQLRSPMLPVMKLAFAGMCDDPTDRPIGGGPGLGAQAGIAPRLARGADRSRRRNCPDPQWRGFGLISAAGSRWVRRAWLRPAGGLRQPRRARRSGTARRAGECRHCSAASPANGSARQYRAIH